MTSSVHACEATAPTPRYAKMLQARVEKPGLCCEPSFVENRIQLRLFRATTNSLGCFFAGAPHSFFSRAGVLMHARSLGGSEPSELRSSAHPLQSWESFRKPPRFGSPASAPAMAKHHVDRTFSGCYGPWPANPICPQGCTGRQSPASSQSDGTHKPPRLASLCLEGGDRLSCLRNRQILH